MTVHSEPGRTSGSLSRRRVLAAGAWSVPVVAIAVASPAAAASGDVVLSTYGPIDVDARTKVFGLTLAGLPAVQPSDDGVYVGALIDFCLPEGLAVVAVSSGWAFSSAGEAYEGGDCYVYNTAAISAGSTVSVDVTVALDPALESLEGILGADVIVDNTYIDLVAWNYLYGTSTGTPLPNCAAPENRR